MSRALTALLVALAGALAACDTSATPGESGGATNAVALKYVGRASAADDDAAMKDLQESERWIAPRCRWLESGAWVVPSVAEEVLLQAASRFNYVDLTEVGHEFHFNRNAPALKVVLTDAGRSESGRCGQPSKTTSWGLPVSMRRFISGTFVSNESVGRTVYDVEFEWITTSAADTARFDLPPTAAIDAGVFHSKVYMFKGRDVGPPGRNGWAVMTILDR